MMYQAGYVLVVKDSNEKILRETGSSSDKQVFLPYNSEYSLLLKNKTVKRVVAEVFIDGTDVLGGRRLLIEPNSDYNLERFLVNGNLGSGRRFKFVSPDHPDVQDPYSSELGEIRVRFYEVNPTYYSPVHIPVNWQIPKQKDPWAPFDPWNKKFESKSKGIQDFSCSVGSDFVTRSGDNVGATVEGSYSNQRFEEVNHVGDISSNYTEIRLRILAPKTSDSSITVRSTRWIFCSVCGHKNPSSANYCANCGAKLQKVSRY